MPEWFALQEDRWRDPASDRYLAVEPIFSVVELPGEPRGPGESETKRPRSDLVFMGYPHLLVGFAWIFPPGMESGLFHRGSVSSKWALEKVSSSK